MFKYTICEPLNPTIVDKGSVPKDEFREILRRFPWQEMQRVMDLAQEFEIYYSPSLELVDLDSSHSLAISIVDQEFYIFYKRPKNVKKRSWFKSVDVFEPEYLSDRTNQNEKDVEDAFNALLEGNFELLESRWG